MMLSNIALFIDTASRALQVSTVAVTQTVQGLVLRFGAEVGPLWQLTKDGEFRPELPILVGTRGYAAQSSAGFVTVITPHNWVWQGARMAVVGIQGMPWQKAKGLAPLKTPQEVVVLRPGTNIIPVATGAKTANPEGYRRFHSNASSADAALEGLRLRARGHEHEVVIAEGQSDYCRGWRLVGYHELYQEPWAPEWPPEHSELFTEEAFAARSARQTWEQEHPVEARYERAIRNGDIEAQLGCVIDEFINAINWGKPQVITVDLTEEVITERFAGCDPEAVKTAVAFLQPAREAAARRQETPEVATS